MRAGWKTSASYGPRSVKGNEDEVEDLGTLNEYGLCFDYVAPQTFDDQDEGYFRYQLSWGGPSDEFRIYAERIKEYRWSVYRIEYWFMDWFDGAPLTLYNEERKFIEEIFTSYFVDCGSADQVYEAAMEDWQPPAGEEDESDLDNEDEEDESDLDNEDEED